MSEEKNVEKYIDEIGCNYHFTKDFTCLQVAKLFFYYYERECVKDVKNIF